MRDHRMAVGVSLKGKIEEFGFFLLQTIDTLKTIEQKHLKQDYPLNLEMDKSNYYFSAFLNSVQSLKDVVQTATQEQFRWEEISPTYGEFIYYCRNAITHDGSHLINAGQGTKSYIVGPLRRIDSRGRLVEFDPPKEDVLTLCSNLATELLNNLQSLLALHGSKIPLPNEDDFKKGIDSSLEGDFIPGALKALIKANRAQIEASVQGVTINVVQRALDAIASVKRSLADLSKGNP